MGHLCSFTEIYSNPDLTTKKWGGDWRVKIIKGRTWNGEVPQGTRLLYSLLPGSPGRVINHLLKYIKYFQCIFYLCHSLSPYSSLIKNLTIKANRNSGSSPRLKIKPNLVLTSTQPEVRFLEVTIKWPDKMWWQYFREFSRHIVPATIKILLTFCFWKRLGKDSGEKRSQAAPSDRSQ